MKTTDFKDLGKVNQILPMMQEHFGKSMNLARIKFMAFMLHALCVVQTVSLHKLAAAMPTSVERDSNLRRIQRFIAKYALNFDLVAQMIYSLLPVKTGLVLSMDRTNWKFGDFNINILMLGVAYIAFPLMFSLLPKKGNSNWKERKAIVVCPAVRLRMHRLSCCRPGVCRQGLDRLAQPQSYTILYPDPAEFLACQALQKMRTNIDKGAKLSSPAKVCTCSSLQ